MSLSKKLSRGGKTVWPKTVLRADCVAMLRLALLVAVVGGANAGDGGGGGGLFTSTARYVRLYEVERSLAEVLQVSE